VKGDTQCKPKAKLLIPFPKNWELSIPMVRIFYELQISFLISKMPGKNEFKNSLKIIFLPSLLEK